MKFTQCRQSIFVLHSRRYGLIGGPAAPITITGGMAGGATLRGLGGLLFGTGMYFAE
ncbi:hypothetical protein [Actinomadura sp. DC4]|uniref:hypothetical protein n=1 Tax=Actinomadura sp. DC4 TaxID=3055069 RepID=UPI0025B0CC78|nr:hypothetical protein [Actinomadura sp. DC4]MDN3360100.1 hypothetical protein [Actinomadura sp. DC4]